MRFLFIRVEKANYPVTVLCRVLEVTRSGYYAFELREPSARATKNVQLVAKIKSIDTKYRHRYGSPRMHRELVALGESVGLHRVARLMSENEIEARQKRRFCVTTNSGHGLPVAENVLERRFEAEVPDRFWVTDITYIPTDEGWLYLAIVLDLFSRRVVGMAMSERIDRHLILGALEDALKLRRPGSGLLHHSDRGSQYASIEYQDELRKHGILCSMSRRGNCWDNAVAESFFSTLKMELVYEDKYASRMEARRAIHEYVHEFYNVDRRHSALGYVSPIAYELMAQIKQSAA